MFRHRPLSAFLVVMLAAVGAVEAVSPGASAQAPANKTYTSALVVSPVSADTTPATYTFTFTLTNAKTSPQAFGSGEITVPSGFALASSVFPITTSSGQTNFSATTAPGGVLITSTGPTGSGIQPGQSLTIAVTASTNSANLCSTVWPIEVKQSNDFSGTGNDFGSTGSATTGSGADHLAYATSPSTTEFDTNMTPAPQVAALDPCGKVDTSRTGSVTLTDSNPTDDVTGAAVTPPVMATTQSASFVNGVASFPAITFSDFGFTDALTAASSGLKSVTSGSFDVVQRLTHCAPNKACDSGTLSDKASTTLADVAAAAAPNADILTVSVKGDPQAAYGTCHQPGPNPEPPFGSVVSLSVTQRAKTVTMTLPKAYVNLIPNNGTPFMDVCLNLPSGAFVDKFGDTVSTGLLPNCSTSRTTTCVTDRRKNAGNEIITFVLPGGDPHTSWY